MTALKDNSDAALEGGISTPLKDGLIEIATDHTTIQTRPTNRRAATKVEFRIKKGSSF